MFKRLALAGFGLLSALSASAAVVTYTDRAAFEAAVSGFTMDDLTTIQPGSLNSGADRGAYSFNMSSFGCVGGPGQCGDNAIDGMFYDGYVWTYGSGNFVFDNAINAFGLDFGQYLGNSASVTLGGYTHSVTNGGFFGILDTTNTFTTVSYAAQGSGSLFDNVTYGNGGGQTVPEPSTLALIGLSLAGLALGSRRKPAKA